jgi:hypothetical protein
MAWRRASLASSPFPSWKAAKLASSQARGELGEGLLQGSGRGGPAGVLEGPKDQVGGGALQGVPGEEGLGLLQGLFPLALGEEAQEAVGPGEPALPEEEKPFGEEAQEKPRAPPLPQVQGRLVEGVGVLSPGQGPKAGLVPFGRGEGAKLGGQALLLEPEPGHRRMGEEAFLHPLFPGQEEPEAPLFFPAQEDPVRPGDLPGQPGPRPGVKPPTSSYPSRQGARGGGGRGGWGVGPSGPRRRPGPGCTPWAPQRAGPGPGPEPGPGRGRELASAWRHSSAFP